jgi:hypothetical protein
LLRKSLVVHHLAPSARFSSPSFAPPYPTQPLIGSIFKGGNATCFA